MKLKNIILASFVLVSSSAVLAAVSPSTVKMTIYAALVSTSTDCSNPVLVSEFPGGQEFDFMSTPNLGGGYLADGTYPCVILKMSDVVKFKPATTTGSCTAGTEYTLDVCRAGGGTYTPTTVANGTATFGTSGTACTGTQLVPVNNQVGLFLSTASTNGAGGNGQAFDRPTNTANGFTLSGAFVLSGSASKTFIVNFNNKIEGSNADCDLNAPVFGFR